VAAHDEEGVPDALGCVQRAMPLTIWYEDPEAWPKPSPRSLEKSRSRWFVLWLGLRQRP